MAIFLPDRNEWLCAHCRGSELVVVPGTFRKGQRGFIEPGTPEWLSFITPSKVAAVVGMSRWESAYRLWHRMKRIVAAEDPKDIFDIGHDWEPAAANRWKRKNEGWRLSPGEVQLIIPPNGTNSFGFPVIVTLDRRATKGRARRIVEFKTARRMEDWGDEFTDDAPADYVAQCIAQMLFTGWTDYAAHLLVIGPYFNDHIYEIPYDHEIAKWIVQSCNDFYKSLHFTKAPALDDHVATYECVRELHPDIDGSTAEVDYDLGIAVHDANGELKAAQDRLRGLKTRLLDAMGNAQYAEARGLKIATRSPHAKGSVALNLARTHPASQTPKTKGDAA
ncbi:YqaJ viral recombinase family protein [Mycolicibacterium goodii]|nr:YqaJ viral recombinase family protein [Mycolicibacterium goodii]